MPISFLLRILQCLRQSFEALKKEDIFVRYFRADRIDNYLRITIGTGEEMEALFAFLSDYLKNR